MNRRNWLKATRSSGRSMFSSLRSLTLLGALSIALAACSGDGSTAPRGMGFTGRLSGDRTGTRSGFMNVATTSASFDIYGGTPEDDFDFDLVANTAGLPAIGTHQIGYGPDDFYSSVYVDDFASEHGATSGTVTIASATTSLVTGSFNVTYSNAEEVFTFAGTFSATACADCLA
jgi:hypothetical protein